MTFLPRTKALETKKTRYNGNLPFTVIYVDDDDVCRDADKNVLSKDAVGNYCNVDGSPIEVPSGYIVTVKETIRGAYLRLSDVG
jgi:hypothetical protein